MSDSSTVPCGRCDVASQLPTARPFAALSLQALEAQLASACALGDGPVGAHCIHEFTMRGTIGLVISRWLERLWMTASDTIPAWLPMTHVEWLALAYEVTGRFKPHSRGNRCVYLILLDYADSARGPHGVYVGVSRYSPVARFEQHKLGIRASGVVTRRGIEPLPGPTLHLERMSLAEAEQVEEQVAEALRARGLMVKGGH